MDLNILWFILIAVLYTGFFVLEGFDYGVGILLPFLAKDDTRRRVIINSIGPFWDANEVWLLTAGGATFAAFPHWYATLFSGFYMALFLLLVALILRGVAFEFRSKDENPRWRNFWDWMIFVGSFLPALLIGVAFSNLVRGVPIDANMNYVGGFWNLLNWYALLGGLTAVAVFSLFGAIFLSLKTTGEVTRSGPIRSPPPLASCGGAFPGFCNQHLFCDGYPQRPGHKSGCGTARRDCSAFGGWVFHPPISIRCGVHLRGFVHRLHCNHLVYDPVSPGDDLQLERRLEFDDLFGFFQPVYLKNNDHRRSDIRAIGPDLPGLDVLGISQTSHCRSSGIGILTCKKPPPSFREGV